MAIILTSVHKYRDKNGNIVGYRVKDVNGEEQDMRAEILKAYMKNSRVTVTNLTLTSDGRLVDTTSSKVEMSKSKNKQDSILGCIFGLLVGDAVGVPFEFKDRTEILPYDKIDIITPSIHDGFSKSYPSVPNGTWSDDGAQALCLMVSLVNNNNLDIKDFAHNLSRWYRTGFMAVDEVVFDIGNQTKRAIECYENGIDPENSGSVDMDAKGNGSLMRTAPVALIPGTDLQIVYNAHKQSLVTHGHPLNQVCCAMYSLVAKYMINSVSFENAVANAYKTLEEIYLTKPFYLNELKKIKPKAPWGGRGSGYVLDSLHSAFMVMNESIGYKDAIRKAIMLGNDTDTTACIVGGLAGIKYGYSGIPSEWLDNLRDKEKITGLVNKVLEINA